VTIREFTALVRLYEACVDPELRARVERLVPELREWDASVRKLEYKRSMSQWRDVIRS
jgi:hypothetical protein